MVKYLIFIYIGEAFDFINQINQCKGYPDSNTLTYVDAPDLMCEFDYETETSKQIGYGVVIKDFIMDCLTEQQISDILILPNNINICTPFSGTTS